MYTQCPECGTSFRVTAEVLKQAAGKVRCGGCGNAFNAVAYLSETKPEARRRPDVEEALPELTPDPFEDEAETPPPRRMSAAQSAALLKTLDQLAGEDIRIEDTGVEWRLMDDDDEDDDAPVDPDASAIEVVESFDEDEPDTPDADADADADAIFTDTRTPLDPLLLDADDAPGAVDEILSESPTPVDEFLTETPHDIDAHEVFADDRDADIDAADVFEHPDTPADDVLRFDDNTGLPEDFDFDALSEPATAPAPVEEPERIEEPMQLQADIAFGEPDEWGDLLSEVDPAAAVADTVTADDADETAIAAADDEPDEATVLATPDDEPAEPMTFAEELAALPDYDDEADTGIEALDDDAEDDEAVEDPLAASGIDLSGIYASTDFDDDLSIDDDGEHEPAQAAEDEDEDDNDRTMAADDEAIAGDAVEAAAGDDLDPDTDDDLDLDLEGEFDDVRDDELALDADDALATQDDTPDEDDDERAAAGEAPRVADSPAPIPADTSELQFQLDQARDALNPDLEFDPTRTIVPPPSEEEQTVNMMIDEDLMRLAITDDEGMSSTMVLQGKASKSKSGGDSEDPDAEDDAGDDTESLGTSSSSGGAGFETIIMEGAFSRTEEEQRRHAADAAAHQKLLADAALADEAAKASGARSRRMHYGIIAGVVVLALLLAGQFVHQSRAELATIPAVGDTIAPLYRAVGSPITPEWDVTGWRFEVTRGSMSGGTTGDDGIIAEDDVLTIYSRLGNQSDAPLPYPLLAVSLTDRFDDVLGSKVLEPADYLDEGISAQGMIGPGTSFEAVIAIDMPADEADGFKLNACYRKADGQLRCAIEDFR